LSKKGKEVMIKSVSNIFFLTSWAFILSHLPLLMK